MRHANDSAQPLHLSVEVRVAKKAANKRGGFILPDAHHNQAIASVPQLRQIEICIAREECNVPVLAQENEDLAVLHAFAAEINSNLLCPDPKSLQQEPLVVEDVLVQNDQAGARWSTYSGAAYWAE